MEISRIAKACKSERFISRVYSADECALFLKKKDPTDSQAVNWAAKEAFGKAIGTGIRGFALNEVECLRDGLGKPFLRLRGRAEAIAESMGLSFEISLSHCKEYAVAVVIGYRGDR